MGGQPSKQPARIAHPSAEGMDPKHLRGQGVYTYLIFFSIDHYCLDLIYQHQLQFIMQFEFDRLL